MQQLMKNFILIIQFSKELTKPIQLEIALVKRDKNESNFENLINIFSEKNRNKFGSINPPSQLTKININSLKIDPENLTIYVNKN